MPIERGYEVDAWSAPLIEGEFGEAKSENVSSPISESEPRLTIGPDGLYLSDTGEMSAVRTRKEQLKRIFPRFLKKIPIKQEKTK